MRRINWQVEGDHRKGKATIYRENRWPWRQAKEDGWQGKRLQGPDS